MADSEKMLAGYSTVGTFAPTQIRAGEGPIVTSRGVYKAGNKFGLMNDRQEIVQVALLAFDADHKLVPWTQGGAGSLGIIAGYAPNYMDTSATGTNADDDSGYVQQDILNWEVVQQANGAGAVTLLQLQQAAQAPGVNITFEKLY
jgi:hypothetical protein